MKKIVVLERGWVVVGKLEKQEDDWFLLEDGFVIRRWGTNKGLGQLAEMGPLENTKLDPIPLTKFHKNKIIFIIDCSDKKWE
jgi:hypothetical protein